ncbi:RNA-directed DNA polymerase, eukaryota, reverse transcriptase zinc-binding domain protein [Tanacetum coccineum]
MGSVWKDLKLLMLLLLTLMISWVNPVAPLDTLGDIFYKTLTTAEAAAMKAWSTIRDDVCLAIKEFFMTGKLLKEVNSTLIALIPKIPNTKLLTEFRPIACCNVIYKCISKILTNRIKNSLDKLVNLNQSAFIQGRNIQDNILLTQELLKGYNRKGGSKRCALKIDIAKAYDTVSWEFLRSILIKFGFHWKMVEWILTCISCSAFSICVNGEVHGYFSSGRGLRQGDPISPYLFTLVMEVFTLIMAHKTSLSSHFRYHVGCKEMKLTHLCFADDLIFLCHGDKESVRVIKDALKDFSEVSGLQPNLSKSTVFFGNVNCGEQRSILKVLPFKIGSLPVKYLGVPLITKRLGKEDCKHLVDMVKNKVNDWKNKFLSYAGRMQLIASVLGSMQIYWASVFLLPKSTVKDIERVLKGFLWCQRDLARGKAKIAWTTLCKPKFQGGLGFKDLGMWNEVLLTKHIWNIAAHKESLWVKWVHIIKLKGRSLWEVSYDVSDIVTRRDMYDARYDNQATLADMIENNKWIWHQEWRTSFPELTILPIPILTDSPDKIMLRCNDGSMKIFSTKQTWNDYRPSYPDVSWKNLDRIFQWSNDNTMKCSLCNTCMDSHDHLFFQCQYASDVWDIVKDKGYLKEFKSDWADTFNHMAVGHCRNIKSVVSRIVFGAIVYFIWQEMNKRCFTKEKRSAKVLCDIIMDTTRMRLISLKVKNSANVRKVAHDWNIKFNFIALLGWPWEDPSLLCLFSERSNSVKMYHKVELSIVKGSDLGGQCREDVASELDIIPKFIIVEDTVEKGIVATARDQGFTELKVKNWVRESLAEEDRDFIGMKSN